MDRVTATTVAVTALVFAGLGCGVDETTVATIGGREIGIDEIQIYLTEASGMTWQAIDDRVASRLFDQFLDQEVMVGAVERSRQRGFPTEPAARSSAVRSLVTEVCGPSPLPSDGDIERELTARLEETRPPRARVRQMLLRDLEEAETARARLAAGEPFIDVSRDLSKAANASTGGELGVLTRGTLSEELEEVVFSLAEGEVSEPVLSPAGYHVFQVLDVVPEGSPSRHELEPVVRRALADELARGHVRRCVDETRSRVGVTVYRRHLWFQYEGRYGESSSDS
jgi:parvulin-like peptidyl-prolyl isomerase